MGSDAKTRKLVYLVTEDWFFCSHFLERARAARKEGYDVLVITNLSNHAEQIRAEGLRVADFGLDRGSTNPLKELAAIRRVWAVYQAEKPDIVHHVALKPVLYGTIAALICGVKAIVNAPVGMGYIFISSSLKARLLRIPVKLALRFLLNPRGSRVIFENGDDLDMLADAGYVERDKAELIRGAGINLCTYQPSPEPEGPPVVLLTARMLWDKGVGEYVEAARRVLAQGYKARFLLAGAPDPLNHASIPEETLKAWQDEGVVQWLGHRDDIPALLQASHIVCLPSYREGLPKSLLEALACGKPVVTTDVQGCRETVENGVNGFLVPVRDSKELARALVCLIEDSSLRVAMGKAGRKKAEDEFSSERVISETLQVYRRV
jgi:glycosyltransferase involved in cell wall biosynthesis